MSTDRDQAFGELRGFLAAFALLNDKTDHGYTFEFERLPAATDAVQAVELSFRGEATKVEATPVDDWPRAVRKIIEKWLFEFNDVNSRHLVDADCDFELSHDVGRQRMIDWVMARLVAVVQESVVWTVFIDTKGFYECACDDVVFEFGTDRFLLHLGVSD